MRFTTKAFVLLLAADQTDAHGAMLMPPARNSIDSTIPGADWGNGHNRTGKIEPLGVKCENGTEACHPGQAVFWFSQVTIRRHSSCKNYDKMRKYKCT
jgi:hypothetical protein